MLCSYYFLTHCFWTHILLTIPLKSAAHWIVCSYLFSRNVNYSHCTLVYNPKFSPTNQSCCFDFPLTGWYFYTVHSLTIQSCWDWRWIAFPHLLGVYIIYYLSQSIYPINSPAKTRYMPRCSLQRAEILCNVLINLKMKYINDFN